MNIYKLIPIGDFVPATALRELDQREGLLMASITNLGSIPEQILHSLKHIDGKIILLNMHRTKKTNPFEMPKRLFPFASMHRNGLGFTYIDTVEAFKNGNYILGFEPSDEVFESDLETEWRDRDFGDTANFHEYRCHKKPEELPWVTNYPAYVNMDRDSDSIGGSSWNGSLTSWLRSGITSRLQYGVKAGLFPEE